MWFEQASLPGRTLQAPFTVRSALCKEWDSFKISSLLGSSVAGIRLFYSLAARTSVFFTPYRQHARLKIIERSAQPQADECSRVAPDGGQS